MRAILLGLFAFAATLFVAEVAKAGDCRRAVVVQEVVQYQAPVQAVVVQKQVVHVQRVQAVQAYGGYGYGQSQFVQRQSFGRRQALGGGAGLGGIVNRQNIGAAIGAAGGAALAGPLGAAGGAVIGNILFGN